MLLSVNSFTSFHIIECDDIDNEETLSTEKLHSANLETAIQLAGYGKFHKILLAVTGLIYATCAISTTTLSFVLPSAECDFELSSASKGKLSAVPLFGMICGCGLWGSIANWRGRRIAIMCSLFVDFLAATTSSFADSFELFMICRFFNGFGIIGATSIVFTYLGEFLPKGRKDMVLGKLEIFWNIGMIILPGIGWLFLSARFEPYFYSQNVTPWRMFILMCSFPSLLSFILLYFLPESPKFLISRDKFDEAKAVFKRIYEINNGNKLSSHAHDLENSVLNEIFYTQDINDKLRILYATLMKLFDEHVPLKTVRICKRKSPWLTGAIKKLIREKNKARAKHKKKPTIGSWTYFKTFLFKREFEMTSGSYSKQPTTLFYRVRKKMELLITMLKELFSWAYFKYIAIISFADFGLMASYYTLMMWFPEIFERFHNFEMDYPKKTATVCDISNFNSTEDSAITCDASIEDRVFLDTAIIALSCIPTSVCLGIAMKTFGKRTVLIVGLILSGLIALMLNIARKSVQVLVISCIFEALTSVLEAVVFCIIVDVLPTNLSAIAVAITATSGRLGAILGNITFGFLLDVYCVIPIYLFGCLLMVSGMMCLTLPTRSNYIPLL